MRVYVMPADGHGCGHYRLIWPAEVVGSQGLAGIEVTIVPPKRDAAFMAKVVDLENGKKVLAGLQIPQGIDVLVMQRPAHMLHPQMIQMIRSQGIAVVVDMDDDMSSIHPSNAAFQMYRSQDMASRLQGTGPWNAQRPPSEASRYSWRYAAEACKYATLVTVSTKQLQRVYARHGRVAVLDNYVPEAYLDFGPVDSGGTFGWAGTTKSHPNDLQEAAGSAQRLIDEGHPFKVVGGRSEVKRALKLRNDPEFTGSLDLLDWVRVIGETLDVGMVPLAPSAFNSAKSRLKGIEYMAVGVPWVASPREEYRKLHRESGCGLLATDRKDWYTQLKRLLADEVLRKEQAEAGREYMRNQTYQAQAWRWAETWTRALEMERG